MTEACAWRSHIPHLLVFACLFALVCTFREPRDGAGRGGLAGAMAAAALAADVGRAAEARNIGRAEADAGLALRLAREPLAPMPAVGGASERPPGSPVSPQGRGSEDGHGAVAEFLRIARERLGKTRAVLAVEGALGVAGALLRAEARRAASLGGRILKRFLGRLFLANEAEAVARRARRRARRGVEPAEGRRGDGLTMFGKTAARAPAGWFTRRS